MSAPTAPKFIGAPIRRKEDPRLITGRATYTDDIMLPRMVHVALARSPEAHARIASIDTSAAAAMPGVVEVYSGADLKDVIAPLPCVHSIEDLKEPSHPAVAFEEVRYAGDAVAVVVAESAAQAEDAAREVYVEYESLPVVVDCRTTVLPEVVALTPVTSLARLIAATAEAAVALTPSSTVVVPSVPVMAISVAALSRDAPLKLPRANCAVAAAVDTVTAKVKSEVMFPRLKIRRLPMSFELATAVSTAPVPSMSRLPLNVVVRTIRSMDWIAKSI